MKKTINVLIIEDEPLIIENLIAAFDRLGESNAFLDFKIKPSTNCDDASKEIDKAINSKPFDLVLLDISIPPSSDGRLLCGEDLGIELKSYFPNIKIIVFTSHSNNYRLNSILKSLNPDGFLIKSDINFKKLLEALESVINNLPYYSKVILQLMRRYLANDFILDKIDRQLLYELSKGTKTKNLTGLIPLSLSAIESRKRNLKELFEVENGNDRQLILRAEQHGFI